MRAVVILLLTGLVSCGGGASGSGGSFRLIEFLEAGKNNIPRNRQLTFIFTSAVGTPQDFPERLKIQNVQTGAGQSSFARAVGTYLILAERVIFTPDLPVLKDRGDAGFRADGNYVVFLKAGPDALQSVGGKALTAQQEFIFDTNEFFEDVRPAEPPRALSVTAVDPVSGATTDLSRIDPRPEELALTDNEDLILNTLVIDPGAGGPPNFATRWAFDLEMSEPVDPATVTPNNIELSEVFADATTSADTAPGASAPDGYFGSAVNFKVPIVVEPIQGLDAQGNLRIRIRVTPLVTLVDDTRYRLTFGGRILGLDFRQTFIGENGLTGDGQTVLSGVGQPFPEPGGLGYTTEFIVRDRPTISAERVLEYDPLADGIQPETGATTLDETLFNSALYNPPANPSTAVGFLGAFGSGADGDLAVAGGQTTILDTGDTPNLPLEMPFTVIDRDPTDTYKNTSGFPASGPVTYDSFEPTVFDFGSVVVSSSSTLRIIGVNPCRILAAGLVQIQGTIDAGGGDGGQGGQAAGANATAAPGTGGVGGPAGFPGGEGSSVQSTYNGTTAQQCTSFDAYLTNGLVNAALFPHSKKGAGPGRGHSGGEAYTLGQQQNHNINSNTQTGTGGGGGSHGTAGTAGEDRFNLSGAAGTPGVCERFGFPNSSLIGLRGSPGPVYGDREALDIVMGGSSGGAGGGQHGWFNSGGGVANGGGGGGGGGFLEILSSGNILVQGTITVAGGDGGRGAFQSQNGGSWTRVAGSGGAGAGGTLSLISGNNIDMTGAILDARGGVGGPRPNNPPAVNSCTGCNAGGDGGRGFLHLMDADGFITGLLPGLPNPGEPDNFDNYTFGILSVRQFDVNRFGGVNAVTELYGVGAPNPTYLQIAPEDILAKVTGTQTIEVFVSSAASDADEPLKPDLTTEISAFRVATISANGSATIVTIDGDLTLLNTANRDAFARVQAVFMYLDPIEAALGPFMSMDEVILSLTFN